MCCAKTTFSLCCPPRTSPPLNIRQVSMPVLNGVREVKSSMNKLLTRVQRLKQELEDILDDDDDMAVRQSGL